MRKLIIIIFTYQFVNCQINITNLIGIDTSHLVIHDEFHKLTKNTSLAFLDMQKAAKNDGIDLQIVSSFRTFNKQKNLWNKKFKRFSDEGNNTRESLNMILRYSAVPGTSRHHWGTEIDITDRNVIEKHLLNSNKFHNGGPFEPLHNWMMKNAHKYGFYLVYTDDKDRNGFLYEPWHYSYKPDAIEIIKSYDIRTGFAYFKTTNVSGSEIIDINFWNNYMQKYFFGINPILIPEL
ncbi:MAG: M15 family metallopeptidase [Bacteroidota bacterium]|nr:M15 family metallopeptidase [Bacteroidota bacterium]MEC8363659.1 M15 family metallopeptidase [Bacteroidota bacterium]